MIGKTASFLLAVAVLVSPQLTKAQTQPSSAGATTSRTLIALENRWMAALQNSDVAVLNSILADTYVDTDEDGQRTDKQGALAAVKSGPQLQSVKFSGIRVYVYGDAAVVTGMQNGALNGQSPMPTILFTDTFIRQNGHWRAVASHRSAVRK
jgi:hypothetical protein